MYALTNVSGQYVVQQNSYRLIGDMCIFLLLEQLHSPTKEISRTAVGVKD